jgi:hypothetical protein
MQRLDFKLPDFCRISWVSEAARARWEPVMTSARQLVADLEVQTVLLGMRECALVAIPESHFEAHAHQMMDVGLSIEVLEKVAISCGYASTLRPATSGPSSMWCAVGRKAQTNNAFACFKDVNTTVLGKSLGYPECCIAFFNEIWNQGGFIDTTWPMAQRTKSQNHASQVEVHVAVRPENNILLRWVGVRPVFHLPCCFDCTATFELARAIRQAARDLGREGETDGLYEMLAMPAEWSALHGIAEIVTAAFRIVARTDATGEKYVVRLNSAELSKQAPSGLTFPFKPPAKKASRFLGRFEPSAESETPGGHIEHERWYFEDNGFYSKYDMDYAHRPLVDALSKVAKTSVLDLGCGNGALLRKTLAHQPSLVPFGVDVDRAKLDHAKLLLPTHRDNFIEGNFFERELWNSIPDVGVIIFMLGRLTEISRVEAAEFLRRTRHKSRCMLVYAYPDWLQNRTLEAVGAALGLVLSNHLRSDNYVAQILRPD